MTAKPPEFGSHFPAPSMTTGTFSRLNIHYSNALKNKTRIYAPWDAVAGVSLSSDNGHRPLSRRRFYLRLYMSTCYNHFIPIIVYNSGCGKRWAHINWSMVRLLSTCPLHTNSGCGKREAHINCWSMVTCEMAAPVYWNYLEDCWPCAGGLSAVNVIGTQLRYPMKSALTQ